LANRGDVWLADFETVRGRSSLSARTLVTIEHRVRTLLDL
jgi:hypothetical protein